MKERNPHALRGVACSALGGVCWGFSGTCGQYLFSTTDISTLWLTCIRLLTAGTLMLLLALRSHRRRILELPQKLVNVIHCKNPRCITVSESQLDAIFLLSDPAKHTYRCAYCDTEKKRSI